MLLALTMTVGFIFVVWLIFFKLKWMKFSIMWGILCAFFFIHILLIFMIGLRFVTPYSTDAKVIQHTTRTLLLAGFRFHHDDRTRRLLHHLFGDAAEELPRFAGETVRAH